VTVDHPVSLVDDRTGLIRWVLDIPIEPGEPTIFNASIKMAQTTCYNLHPCYDNNGGSGLTREQARAAAIGEGVERYCCSVFDPSDLICGSAAQLGRDNEICRPSNFAMFHPDQPGRFPGPSEETQVAWTWGWSLVRQRPILVPASLVYMPYFPCFREQGEQVAGPAVSTGLACARSLEEAILKGLYELVERDAFMIAWLNRLPLPSVNIESNLDLRRFYQERLRRDGLRYVVVHITTDIPLPSFLCLLIDERRTPPMISAGAATDLNPTRAARKAMMEAVQTREWAKFLGGLGRKFQFASDFSDIRDFEHHVALYAYGDMLHAVAFLLDEENRRISDCWEDGSTGDIEDDLDKTLNILAGHNLEAIALDLTTPDVNECGYRVTRAMVPELQPLDADYLHRFLGGRRLYEVPWRMGYTSAPTTIETLNSNPHPFP
jgi:ribosomal protein S12 methylthiotransferase accessory factor